MGNSSPTHKVGDLINLRYEVVELLGRGGMSNVYKVRDQNLGGQQIALKLLDSLLLSDINNIERFRREAIVARQLDHTNIVRVYDFDVTEAGEYFLTMELIEGSNLSDRLKDFSDPVPLNKLTEILFQIASALEHAHKQGVVHRDLKPANVLLTKEGKVKIADFGLCRASCFDSALSSSGECLGTPAYMSPEQIRGDHIDGRSDIYSLGILAYEACEGTVPFKADTWFKVAEMHLRSPLPKLSTDFPDWYRDMVLRCAAKIPEQRFESAEQLIALLEAHLSLTDAPQRKRRRGFEPYLAGGLGAFCIASMFAVLGVIGAKHFAEPEKQIASERQISKSLAYAETPPPLQEQLRKPSMDESREEPMRGYGNPQEYRRNAPSEFDRDQMASLDQNNRHVDMNQFEKQMQMRQPMERPGNKLARFICSRSGRTIETSEIPEGKNWDCRPSSQNNNQMEQHQGQGLNQGSGQGPNPGFGGPRFMNRQNNRPGLLMMKKKFEP